MTRGTPTPTRESVHKIAGPWSLRTSRQFWEGFSPSALPTHESESELRAVFLSDTDWQRAEVVVTQERDSVRIAVTGDGDLDAATAQVSHFLSLDIDGRTWPEVGDRDPVIANTQRQLPGFRPCGFSSPYEAAAWSVLSQRIRMSHAAVIKARLTAQHGDQGAFPAPSVLVALDLDLPGRKSEYLNAVARAALDGVLSGERLRSLDAAQALEEVQKIKGIGPFGAELVVIRGANFPDVLPHNEKRLHAELGRLYGSDRAIAAATEGWRPFRTWASVSIRALRESR